MSSFVRLLVLVKCNPFSVEVMIQDDGGRLAQLKVTGSEDGKLAEQRWALLTMRVSVEHGNDVVGWQLLRSCLEAASGSSGVSGCAVAANVRGKAR